ncbi:hypothetical protein Tco_1207465, partial [Tanacetum coccineum]
FVLRVLEDGKGGGDLVFLIGGRITRDSIDQQREEVVRPGEVEMVVNVSNRMPCYMLRVLCIIKRVELEKTLDVTEVEVGCPGKVEMVQKKVLRTYVTEVA